MTTSPSITTLQTFDTIYAADSAEWCPVSDLENYFVCGTYELDNTETSITSDEKRVYKRQGKIYLMRFDEGLENFIVKDVKETSAILDMKWLKATPILGVANSIGQIEIYQLTDVDGKLFEKQRITIDENEPELLALSLDWSSDEKKMVSSDSKGGIHLFNFDDSSGLVKDRSWNAHGFEAWTCAFDRTNYNIIYTGGDDTFLNMYDSRTGDATPSMSFKNKTHTAGVTSLLSLAEFSLITGSYDEILRQFDTRMLRHPVSELNLGGGIWRIKMNPLDNSLLLCACMYHNFSIVRHNVQSSKFELISEYFEHNSICYGSDWSTKFQKPKNYYFTTCSMYDHKLNLSIFNYDTN